MSPDWRPTFERIERQRTQLLELLRAADPAALMQQPAPGRWSALQNVEHLILAERGSLRYLLYKRQQGEAPAPLDGGAPWRLGLLLLSLWQPTLRFAAPAPVSQPPNDRPLATVAADWAELRAELRQFLEQAPDAWHQGAAYRHPRAGRLTLVGMLRFFEAHVARHDRQLRRALDGR